MSAQTYYQSGRFAAEHDGPSWDAHLAIRAFLDRDCADDAHEAIRDFRDVAEAHPDETRAIVDQYPFEYARGGETLRETFRLELARATGAVPADALPIAPDGERKPRAILTTQDFTASGRATQGYVIKGFLGRRSYAELFGAPGEGKTFAALDMAYAVAQGREWMGRKVKSGLVLYIPFEGTGGLTKRVRALVQRYGHAPKFRVIENPDYNLREMKGRQALGQDLAQLPEKPILICIDTLAYALMGGDENSAQDVGAFNSAIAALIGSTGATVLLIHHSGKDRGKGSRGSSALLGAIDTELEASGGAIHSRKQRDAELAAPVGFQLVPVVVDQDEDGEDVVSCVLEPTARVAREQALPAQAAEALKALCDLSPNNAPVAEKDWQAAFGRQAWPVDPPESKSQRVAFRRAVKVLGERVTSPRPGQWQRALIGGEK